MVTYDDESIYLCCKAVQITFAVAPFELTSQSESSYLCPQTKSRRLSIHFIDSVARKQYLWAIELESEKCKNEPASPVEELDSDGICTDSVYSGSHKSMSQLVSYPLAVESLKTSYCIGCNEHPQKV